MDQARLAGSSNWRAWLAEGEGNAVGTIWLQLVEKIPNPVAELEWHGYITSLFVRESFRGRELGSRLLRAALDACEEKGVDGVILWPTPQSRSLYTRQGFVVSDQIMQRR
jgi:GNAT superfamily N-acetyltransferase